MVEANVYDKEALDAYMEEIMPLKKNKTSEKGTQTERMKFKQKKQLYRKIREIKQLFEEFSTFIRENLPVITEKYIQ